MKTLQQKLEFAALEVAYSVKHFDASLKDGVWEYTYNTTPVKIYSQLLKEYFDDTLIKMFSTTDYCPSVEKWVNNQIYSFLNSSMYYPFDEVIDWISIENFQDFLDYIEETYL